MEQFVWETAEELDQKLAQRVRNIRKRRSISQEKLSSMSGVSYGSIKRFGIDSMTAAKTVIGSRIYRTRLKL